MLHETPLMSTIVAALVLAFVLGAIANRLRLPPLIGYLLAGVAVGPYTPGFVADTELALELSEIGVILLMFGVGLHFSLRDLLSVRALAIPGALVQILGATGMGVGLALLMGWDLIPGVILGLAMSVASTVVLLKALQERHMIDSEKGRIAVGWLIVEDIAMILALVLLPALASLTGVSGAELNDPFVRLVERVMSIELGIVGVLAVTVVKLAAFVGFMLIVGRRLIPLVLHYTAHTGSRELFRLAVLAIALGVAVGSAYLFGVSLALGAFFAGMILSESELSHRAAEETLPLRDAFSVLFFVAVGMLFDPQIFVDQPLPVLAVLFIVLIGKSVLAFLIVVLFRHPVGTALTISASLAQIGEFSFILAALSIDLGIFSSEGRDLIVAGAIVSIVANPAMFWLAERLRPAVEARFGRRDVAAASAALREPSMDGSAAMPPAAEEVEHVTALTHHTVLVGYGRVGSVVGAGLQKEGRPFVLIEDSEARVAAAREAGIEVVEENAATSKALRLANVAGAETVIVAIPNAFEAGQVTEGSRKLNSSARIIVRAHSDEEEQHFKSLGANSVLTGEREIGLGMLDLLHAVAQRPEATDAMAAFAVQKALDPRRVEPTFEPTSAEAAAAASASIEAALGRALDLKNDAEADAEEAAAQPLEPDLIHEAETWLHEPAANPAETESGEADVPAAGEAEMLVVTATLPETEMPPDDQEVGLDAVVEEADLHDLAVLDPEPDTVEETAHTGAGETPETDEGAVDTSDEVWAAAVAAAESMAPASEARSVPAPPPANDDPWRNPTVPPVALPEEPKPEPPVPEPSDAAGVPAERQEDGAGEAEPDPVAVERPRTGGARAPSDESDDGDTPRG